MIKQRPLGHRTCIGLSLFHRLLLSRELSIHERIELENIVQPNAPITNSL